MPLRLVLPQLPEFRQMVEPAAALDTAEARLVPGEIVVVQVCAKAPPPHRADRMRRYFFMRVLVDFLLK